jgi:SWI/SNF-related matrix-associated actin-dependent regulator of chromatin subfamily A3
MHLKIQLSSYQPRNLKSPKANSSSVVFSFWTSTLDIVELALNRSSISCERVDGKLNMKKRVSAFQNFRDNKNVAVLLLSLSCGAVG